MNLSKQIQYFRKRDNLSQEGLAEKIYVSRQTISNWERDYSYPDIQSLLLLSVLFDVSLDELVKGDVKIMKNTLQKSNFFKWTYTMIALIIMAPISVAPAMYFFDYYGLVLPAMLFVLLMFSALKIEKVKKEYNLKTYRQIVDLVEGKPVNKAKPSKKDKLLKVVLVFASARFVNGNNVIIINETKVNMMAHRYNPDELELLFEQIKSDLQKKVQNQGDYLELVEKGDDFILKFKKKKSQEEKKAILKELEGSGLQHGSEVIEDALNIAYRHGEEDREGLDIG